MGGLSSTKINLHHASFGRWTKIPKRAQNWKVANNLRTIRKTIGWTQKQAAEALRTTINEYGKLERDKHGRRLTDKWIDRAASAFGVDPGTVVTEALPAIFLGPEGMAFAVIPQTGEVSMQLRYPKDPSALGPALELGIRLTPGEARKIALLLSSKADEAEATASQRSQGSPPKPPIR